MSNAIAVSHGEFGRAALYELDNIIVTHAHREGHLVFYIDGGDARMVMGDQASPVNAGHCAAVGPWEPHSFQPAEGTAQLCLVLYIKPMWFLKNSDDSGYALNFGSPSIAMTDDLNRKVRLLTSCLLGSEDADQFDQMLFDLTKASFDQSWAASNGRPNLISARRLSDYRVRRSLRLLEDVTCESIEMEELARRVGLSRPHFFKLFKQYMGVTPNVYMNTLRSERAINHLLSSDRSITDIAFDLGFSSQASFTRFFSSNVGIAPSEYRRVAHLIDTSFPMM